MKRVSSVDVDLHQDGPILLDNHVGVLFEEGCSAGVEVLVPPDGGVVMEDC